MTPELRSGIDTILRPLISAGTPRGLHARRGVLCALLAAAVRALHHPWPVLPTPGVSPVTGCSYAKHPLTRTALA